MQIEFRGNDRLNQIAEDAFDFGPESESGLESESESESESVSYEKSKSHRFGETSDSDSDSDSNPDSDYYSSYSDESLSSTSSDSNSSPSSTADSSSAIVQQSNRFSALELSDSLSIPTRSTTAGLSPQANCDQSDTHMSVKLYIQMEYYKNGTLDDLIQSGKVSIVWISTES